MDVMLKSTEGQKEMSTFYELENQLYGETEGTRANVILVTPDTIYCANLGQSRSVLSLDGVSCDLSVDHKPTQELEQQRIKKAHGIVDRNGKVNGVLPLGRAIGNFGFKDKNLHPRE